MAHYDFFYQVSSIEKGGFGIWYEYLAKSRIFRKFQNAKSVIIFGLPKKYSLGLDTLFFADKSELTVVDDKRESLLKYSGFAKKLSKKVKTHYVKNLKTFKAKKKYDLLITTEVIQDDTSLFETIGKLADKIIVFVPNKRCYAHPGISGLNSLSLKELLNLGKNNNLRVLESGYIDCPPWPAGACLPKKNEETGKNGEKGKNKESILIRVVKKILGRITPLLSKFDKFYISPWKELNSHMIFGIFAKNEK
jgi:hypothetical protein